MLRPGRVLTAIAWLPFTALANQHVDVELRVGTIERWKGTQNSTNYYDALPKSPGVHRSQVDLQIATSLSPNSPQSNEVHNPVQALGGPGVEAMGPMWAETTPTPTSKPGTVLLSVPVAHSTITNKLGGNSGQTTSIADMSVENPLVTLGAGYDGLGPHISQAMLLEETSPTKTITMPIPTGIQGPVVGEAFAHSTVANKPGGKFSQTTSIADMSVEPHGAGFRFTQDMLVGQLHSTQAKLFGDGYMNNGLLGDITATAPTTTSNTILMSGFVFSGTTYPPLPLAPTTKGYLPVPEASSTLAALTWPQTPEWHDSKTAITIITTSTVVDQPAITMPTAYALTTNAPANIDTNSKVLMSAFTFQGTSYPALPIESAAASGTAQPDILETSLPAALPFPMPTVQDVPYRAGLSISGLPVPTTFGNDAGPKPITSASSPTTSPQPGLHVEPAFTAFYDQSTSPIPYSNPGFIGITGSAGGAQSFVTTSRPYALTTDRSGFVSLRPVVTGGVWGNGTGYGGPSGRNGTGGVVPYVGGAGRSRGEDWGWRWWGWGVVVGVGVWWGVGWG